MPVRTSHREGTRPRLFVSTASSANRKKFTRNDRKWRGTSPHPNPLPAPGASRRGRRGRASHQWRMSSQREKSPDRREGGGSRCGSVASEGTRRAVEPAGEPLAGAFARGERTSRSERSDGREEAPLRERSERRDEPSGRGRTRPSRSPVRSPAANARPAASEATIYLSSTSSPTWSIRLESVMRTTDHRSPTFSTAPSPRYVLGMDTPAGGGRVTQYVPIALIPYSRPEE